MVDLAIRIRIFMMRPNYKGQIMTLGDDAGLGLVVDENIPL